MIGYLKGTVIEKSESGAIILAGAVGYDVNLPATILSKLIKDNEVELFVYTHVREDILALYGFGKKEELEFFKLLLSVSGIGPKVALAIISSAPIEKLKDSIAKGDPGLLSAVSGVGKKTAEKAVVELKGKMGKVTSEGLVFSDETDEVIDALTALGFQKAEVTTTLSKLPGEIEGSEAKIKAVLKMVGKK